MPEFKFELTAYYDLWAESYAVQSVDVYEDGVLLQTIHVPELTFFGQTKIYDSLSDTLGFELEDVNFDGYLDIRLFDAPNGTYVQEWIYLVWNPEKQQFERDGRLNEISLAAFDQEKKLIYGMVRGSASSHYYSTYEHIMEINEATGQLKTVSEEYIFWGINAREEKLHIDASSELGKQIAGDIRKYF